MTTVDEPNGTRGEKRACSAFSREPLDWADTPIDWGGTEKAVCFRVGGSALAWLIRAIIGFFLSLSPSG